MKHIEIVEGVIDATSMFKQRKDQHELASQSAEDYAAKEVNVINDKIQDVIDSQTRKAKEWLTHEMKKFRFVVASFTGNSINDTVITSLFIPIFDVNDPNHKRAIDTITKHKSELLEILSGYIEHLKEVMSVSRDVAEKLTGDWRDANELLVNSGINGLFTAVEQLYRKIYYL